MKKVFLFFLCLGIIIKSYSQIDGFRYFTKDISVSITNPVELTDDQEQPLNINHIYKVQLVTRGTGTNTGANYIIWYNPDNSSWKIREINLSGTNSNHPILVIETNKVKVKTNHSSNYTVRVFVEELSSLEPDVTPHIYGASNQWQRKINDLYYNDGNVGIGTTNLSSKFNVLGQNMEVYSGTAENTFRFGRNINENFKFYVTDNNGYIDYIQDSDNNSTHVFYIRNLADGTSNNNDIRFQTTGQDRMTIKANGNVGIGTTSPSEKLEVNGDILGNQYRFPFINYDFSASPRTQLENMSLKLFDDYHTYRPGGVAPGNNNYGTLLAIYGRSSHWEHNLYFGANKKIYYRSSTWSGGTAEDGTTGGFHEWRTILDSKSDIETSGLLKLTGSGNHYISNGNVGIGTTNPQTKLAVNGEITKKEVIVTMDGWSDFVFNEDYRLMSLTDLKEYVKTHDHLPGVPTTKEVSEEGISLGEMNKILLQKIEELTLYIMEQDERIKGIERQQNKKKYISTN